MNTWPEPLQQIYEAVNQFCATPSNTQHVRDEWHHYLETVQQHVPEAHIDNNGETLYLGNLSPGCRHCKAGTWDCIFITVQCNLNCRFCCNPHTIPQDYVGSAFGHDPDQMIANHAKTSIGGISFSGGEPFLNVDRLFEWFLQLKTAYPNNYYWMYTNGLLARESHLQRLSDLGLHEIRFNMAATGYTHPTVLSNLKMATHFIPTVTVEIPAIPEDRPKLLKSLPQWSNCGVRYLNLHELMYEPNTNAANMKGERTTIQFQDGHHTIIAPRSRELILEVMQIIRDLELPLSVNVCSLQSKLLQVRGRRASLVPLTKNPYERLTSQGELESICLYQGDTLHFVHPDALKSLELPLDTFDAVRLRRTLPLSIYDPGQWTAFEPIALPIPLHHP